MLAPTTIDFSISKTDTYDNNVAPAAQIYLHLICRKRHLPLKLRKGKTVGYGAKFSSALTLREAPTVSSIVPNRATRDKCIRSCVKAPLKNNVAVAGVIDLIEDRAHAVVQQLVIEIEPVYEHAQGNDAQRADKKLLFHFVYHPS